MFDRLKADADRLAAEAVRSRRERNSHARRGYVILQRRLGSPPGLVVSFGAGVFAGARSRRTAIHPAENSGPGERRPERSGEGLARWLLHGPIGAAAIKLGTAFLAGALIHPDPGPPPPL